MKKAGIYIFRNIITNIDSYIGSTSNIMARKNAHLTNLRNNIHNNTHFQNAYNKYGESAFVHNILEYCESDKFILEAREQFYVDCLKPSYNKRKVVSSNLGLKRSREAVEKTIKNLIGIPRSQEVKDKIRKTLIGTKRPQYVIDKIAVKLRGRENFKNRKSIVQLDLDGNFIKEWTGESEAKRKLNIFIDTNQKTCGGFIWIKSKKYFSLTPNDICKIVESANRTDYPKNSGVGRQNGKPVIQLSINGNYIHSFESLNEAERQTGTNSIVILRCCQNKPKAKTAGGFKWMYWDNYHLKLNECQF